MFCSNVTKYERHVKPQGAGVIREEETPSLDVRDVNNSHGHCEDGGYPDESRIRGFFHGDSYTSK